MPTQRLTIAANSLNHPVSKASIETAARILRDGGTVAFPTETVYGLGANALRSDAVRKIFEAKQRPSWDPLIVHVASMEMLGRVAVDIPASGRLLMSAFWPGPLTLLLPRHPQVPDIVTAGRPRVGVRIPKHSVAQALLRAADIPIAAPSANTFGHTSPTSAQHVLDDLDGRIDAILDGGEVDAAAVGLESTVVDVCEDPCIVYRPGVITLDQIRAVCPGALAFDESARKTDARPEALPSPGVGLRHYAPKARLILVEYGREQARRFAEQAAVLAAGSGTVGLLLPSDFSEDFAIGGIIYDWGSWQDREELARRLFAGLRWLDARGATVILAPLPEAEGIGVAIRDRLQKAAKTD